MKSPSQYPFPHHPPIPPEHGGWAMLFVGLWLGGWLSENISIVFWQLFGGVVALYLARYPLTLIAMRFRWFHLQDRTFFRDRFIWAFFYLTVAIIFLWEPLSMLPAFLLMLFLGVGGGLFLFEWGMAAYQARKTLASEVIQVGGVAFVATFVYVVLRGGVFDRMTLLLWFLLTTHFLVNLLYVRVRLRSMRRDVDVSTPWLRWKLVAFPLLVMGGILGGVSWLFYYHHVSWVVLLLYVFPLIKMVLSVPTLGTRLTLSQIKQIGWGEVAYSCLFVAVVGMSRLG